MLSLRNLCLTPDLKDVLFSSRSVTTVDFYTWMPWTTGGWYVYVCTPSIPYTQPTAQATWPDTGLPPNCSACHLQGSPLTCCSWRRNSPMPPPSPTLLFTMYGNHVPYPPPHHTGWSWEQGPGLIPMIMAPSTLLGVQKAFTQGPLHQMNGQMNAPVTLH